MTQPKGNASRMKKKKVKKEERQIITTLKANDKTTQLKLVLSKRKIWKEKKKNRHSTSGENVLSSHVNVALN